MALKIDAATRAAVEAYVRKYLLGLTEGTATLEMAAGGIVDLVMAAAKGHPSFYHLLEEAVEDSGLPDGGANDDD